jgi:hypothetical protein
LIPTGERSGLQARRDNGKRFVVHADEKLTAFIELESAIRRPIVTKIGKCPRGAANLRMRGKP